MKILRPFLPPMAALAMVLAAPLIQAQPLRPEGAAEQTELRNPLPTGARARTADYIVAVVNSEPVTNLQVQAEVERLRHQLQAQRQTAPDFDQLARDVLNQLINERAQLQLAQDMGLRVDEPSIDQAEQNVAAQNQLTIEQLHKELKKDGLDRKRFRDQLRDQLLLRRLREREVEPRVRISDQEVDYYLSEQQAKSDQTGGQLLSLAQILIAVPEGASEQQAAELEAKAQQLVQRARAGEDFATLARENSTSADRANGGQLGVRPADRYPPLFVDAVRGLANREIAGPVRSGAGFHIIKLLERRQGGLPSRTVTQSHARHILLVLSKQVSEAQAIARLKDFKRRIQSGETDFGALARENSQDGSAAEGGDLGWSSPGMFVPEFERVMDALAPGQISEPLISRFGVHLIQLIERRTATLTEREQREMVRNMLRDKKFAEAYANWAQDVRARAYVELRDSPQP